MSVIHRVKDRIPLKISDLTFFVSPLKYSQKCEVQALMDKAVRDGDMKAAQDAAFKVVQFAVKEVQGLVNSDGTTYVLEMNGDMLSEVAVDDLMNMQQSTKIAQACASLIDGCGGKIIDPFTGKEVEGLSFDWGDDTEEKKN